MKPKWRVAWFNAKDRCENPKNIGYSRYGGRGIKMLMVAEDFKDIWIRDKAVLMKKPSIDRIDVNGNYEINNCRFIEWSENLVKDQWILDKYQDFKSGHRARMNRYTKRQIDRGLCSRCTLPNVTKYFCEYHRQLSIDSTNRRRKEKMKAGICVNCREKAVTRLFCEFHREKDNQKQKRLYDSRNK